MISKIVVDPPIPNANGVKDELAYKIYDMLVKGRRYFGSSGASLSHHVNNPDYNSEFKSNLVSSGLEGERNTTKVLRQWMQDKPNVILLDSVHVRGMGQENIDEETGQVDGGDSDHLLVINNNVYIIDSKRWKKRKIYSVNDKGTILRQNNKKTKPQRFGGSNIHAKQAKFLWKKYLHHSAKINSIVCVNQENVFIRKDASWKKAGFRLYSIKELTDYLDYHYKRMDEYDKSHVNSTIVSQIAVCCIKPFDSYKRVFNSNIKNFK